MLIFAWKEASVLRQQSEGVENLKIHTFYAL